MKTLYRAIVGLSVAANAAMILLLAAWREQGDAASRPTPPGRSGAASPVPAMKEALAVGELRPRPGEKDPRLNDPAAVAERMKADGYGDQAILMAVTELLRAQEYAKGDGRVRWNQWERSFFTGSPGRGREVEEEASRLTGILSIEQQNQYGALTLDQVMAVRKIEVDWGSRGPKALEIFARDSAIVDGAPMSLSASARAEVRDRMLEEIRTVLSVEETVNYLRSQAATLGMRGVVEMERAFAGIEMDAATRSALLDATILSDLRAPTGTGPGTAAARSEHHAALLTQYRQVLGDERFRAAAAQAKWTLPNR